MGVSVEEFRALCRSDTADEIVENLILRGTAEHVSDENREFIRDRLAATYGIEGSTIEVYVVGSAKLGFSISEKRAVNEVLPRYRPFGPRSDLDIAVVSSTLFRLIWDDLGLYAHGQPWMPWDSGRLGDYLVYGWLRPDKFPRNKRIRRCDDWLDLFWKMSTDRRFLRRSVRGGLYHSSADLIRYQRRSVLDCIRLELDPI